MSQHADDLGRAIRWIASRGGVLTIQSIVDTSRGAPRMGLLLDLRVYDRKLEHRVYLGAGGALSDGALLALEIGQMVKRIDKLKGAGS